jgi:hypothetical protein
MSNTTTVKASVKIRPFPHAFEDIVVVSAADINGDVGDWANNSISISVEEKRETDDGSVVYVAHLRGPYAGDSLSTEFAILRSAGSSDDEMLAVANQEAQKWAGELIVVEWEYIEDEDAVAVYEEGDGCPHCDGGTLGYQPVEGCSCHISPPCRACVTNPFACDSCGWEWN